MTNMNCRASVSDAMAFHRNALQLFTVVLLRAGPASGTRLPKVGDAISLGKHGSKNILCAAVVGPGSTENVRSFAHSRARGSFSGAGECRLSSSLSSEQRSAVGCGD